MQGELQNICKDASREGLLDKIDSPMFTDLLLTLTDKDFFLDINENSMNSFNETEDRKRLITLKCQLDDVETAMEETLGSQPFFAALIQRVKDRNR